MVTEMAELPRHFDLDDILRRGLARVSQAIEDLATGELEPGKMGYAADMACLVTVVLKAISERRAAEESVVSVLLRALGPKAAQLPPAELAKLIGQARADVHVQRQQHARMMEARQ